MPSRATGLLPKGKEAMEDKHLQKYLMSDFTKGGGFDT
jgi:hypothetical protein